jgi:hypothetical protein
VKNVLPFDAPTDTVALLQDISRSVELVMISVLPIDEFKFAYIGKPPVIVGGIPLEEPIYELVIFVTWVELVKFATSKIDRFALDDDKTQESTVRFGP